MFRIFVLFCSLLLCHATANANSTADINTTTCSGSLSSSLTDSASFFCAGNFSLIDGFITSDAKVVITADGSLFLDNISITAPIIELTADAFLFGNGASFQTDSFLARSGGVAASTVGLSPGATLTIGNGDTRITLGGEVISGLVNGDPLTSGTISIVPSIPEPSTYLSMIFGILALLIFKAATNRK